MRDRRKDRSPGMSTRKPTRRTFLKAAGAAVGASAFGKGLSAFAGEAAGATQLGQIKHIVVLMLENRSFDNVLGWLYDPDNAPPFNQVPAGQSFDGLSGKTLTNPVPASHGGGTASPGKETVMFNPNPDPGEPYDDVYAQLFNANPPPSPIPNTTDVPGMQGFVNNYAVNVDAYNADHPADPILADPRIIMNAYTPATLPVLNGLAGAYAVCDHWFCSVPSETFCNRSFVHAGTSSGYVYNSWSTGPHEWNVGFLFNKTPTIYNLLEAAGISWKVYYGSILPFCNAWLCQEQTQQFATASADTNRFFPMPQFFTDAAAPVGASGPDSLPSFSFIEPVYMDSGDFGPENDGHPEANPVDLVGPSNLLQAEKLVYDVYTALRNSPNWDSTLLIITCDEHGGCYDHVPPSPTISPDGVVVPPTSPGGSGFEFNRLGVRVPTILVSPWIPQGTVSNTVYDHTSIIRTAINCFGLTDPSGNPAHLQARDAIASDVASVLTLSAPRTDTPHITPRPTDAFDATIDRPLSGFQANLVGAAAAVLQNQGRSLPFSLQIETTQEATTTFKRYEDNIRRKNSKATPKPKKK